MKPLILGAAGALAFALAYQFTALASPLDDAYIYFQYARSAALGHAFVYHPGDAASTGVSSLLYYAALSILAKAGFQGPGAAFALGAFSFFAALAAWLQFCARNFQNLKSPACLAVFLLLAPLSAAFFNGLETGLFFALFFLVLNEFNDGKISTRGWAFLGLLAFCRPEGQIAAGLLGLLNIRKSGPTAGALSALLASLAPSLIYLCVTGSMIPDSVRPKSMALFSAPFADHALKAAGFAFDSASGIFMNLRGLHATVGTAGDAASGNPPYVHYLPFTLAFALLGFGLRRRWLWVPLWGLGCWLLLAWSLPVGWHQHRYLNALAPVMLLGFACLLDRLPSAPRHALALAWCLFGAVSAAWFRGRMAESAILYQRHHGAAAAWLKQHAPGARVAVVDAGILAFGSGSPTVDLLGVTDHRLALAAPKGGRAILAELLSRSPEARPTLAVLHWQRPDFNPQAWVRAGILRPIAGLGGGQGGEMGVFVFVWQKAEASLR